MNEFLVDADSSYKCISRGLDRLGKLRAQKIKVVTRAGETLMRPMALIDVASYRSNSTAYEPLGKYWADCITGTLYDPVTGKALSSDQMTAQVEAVLA